MHKTTTSIIFGMIGASMVSMATMLGGAPEAAPEAEAAMSMAPSMMTMQTPFAGGYVADNGDIRVPENFRMDYVMLGSWSVEGDADTGGDIGLHVVYAPKEAVIEYRKTGAFPDGTVIVKELFTGETESLTTGKATRAKDLAGYFVMVKDTQNRFPDHPLWGDGWGWAFFGADDTMKTTSTDYRNDCLACHEPARGTDFLYTSAYPVLEK